MTQGKDFKFGNYEMAMDRLKALKDWHLKDDPKWCESNKGKWWIQGVNACINALFKAQEEAIQKRIEADKDLEKRIDKMNEEWDDEDFRKSYPNLTHYFLMDLDNADDS
jgi:hypothetical protein